MLQSFSASVHQLNQGISVPWTSLNWWMGLFFIYKHGPPGDLHQIIYNMMSQRPRWCLSITYLIQPAITTSADIKLLVSKQRNLAWPHIWRLNLHRFDRFLLLLIKLWISVIGLGSLFYTHNIKKEIKVQCEGVVETFTGLYENHTQKICKQWNTVKRSVQYRIKFRACL